MTEPTAARQRARKQAFQVVFVIAGVLILPAALTLRTVVQPGVLEITSENPTPAGYTWSLLLFSIPHPAHSAVSFPSVILGAALIAAAVVYKKLLSVITYEVINIWQALGKNALEAFFGHRVKHRFFGHVP